MNRSPVKESKVIAALAYDQENRILEVEFLNGSVWAYEDFALADWNRLEEAESKGSHFSKCIRNQFPGRKVEPKPEPESADYSPQLKESLKNTTDRV